ncbi:uncharacterized protein LOC106082456 isoform X1 [Stomoxys calcitrans]|uniref:uncharacterized protein LOC106082456 isoform X1 n=1 Tax=Stomoxys calcitrans TaxID=35570 RepID=UPI0027E26E02|nr:uncharacterized protein LOC106082456 isoform X1 [Stomoxys calcitrans]XP_059220893.1 uncharacterized protein LOC106082456 isoform X1 [Stomoxys calcitrans]XP_059220894.1 uncharacterized protein LOC106082456 isoform X1 [Stomoxys calcitrans]XP_059220895.1 uncharacterized protein LOC106082456 isoform X1 [Stomoxys calcitrans]XP_059220896.1 uncharacterized protein LOC106082456 isoform X1 [Stomoxys calcitrans]XP_059220897.1 uncharacterized protein LOC106082456 isoform X1 [Stomoxys calcitrans]
MSAKMNNFSSAATTTETLPKSGHVNEVCKEWLVREDGALAYKLQSQEITDFYKGNRTRNAVVREDFPTALQEQLKEKETAEKQAEAYRRRLKEQEEYDKRVAKEITDKLERDLQEQRLRELESEKLAQDMQAIYVNLPPALPPPSARDKNKVPPPRPAKSSTLLQSNQQPISPPNGYRNPNSPQFPIQLQQHHFSNADGGYVGLSLHATTAQLQQHHRSPTNSHNHNLNHNNLVKLSPEKYDCLVGNATPNQTPPTGVKERHLQEHADDIELYVDPCDYKEIGLPMAEIKEMNAKLKQEQKDELLARRLQELEVQDGMTLEERDRMLAIEAQDKELAKMLQERMDFTTWDILRPGVVTIRHGCNFSRAFACLRIEAFKGILPRMTTTKRIWEKAKAKRAKEKARQRKSQQAKEPTTMPHSQPLPSANGHLPLMAHENGMLTSNSSSSRHSQLSAIEGQQYHADHEDPLDLDAYSNPIDVLKHSQQRTQNGCLTNGSLQRDLVSQQARHASLAREDDIYTLPVDSCRPGHSVANNSNANLRPASMNVCAENGLTVGSAGVGAYSQNSMTRSENFSIHSHDSMNSRHSSNSKTQAFDQNSSPTPPYMPIQGTRRSNSSEDRKKKSKDNKCTHQ